MKSFSKETIRAFYSGKIVFTILYLLVILAVVPQVLNAQPLNQNQIQINEYDTDGYTPLLKAVMNKDAVEAARLLKIGAEPDKPARNGLQGTPLMYAASLPDGVILNILLKAGAEANLLDINGDPAHHWAAFYGYTGNLETLIAYGANLNYKGKHGDALDIVFRLWHADSVITFFRKSVLDEKVSPTAATFMDHVNSGNLTEVEQLLQKGISPDTKDGLQMSALHRAVRTENAVMVSLLLKYGANPDILNRVGQTPLAIASRFNREKIITLLLQAGASVDAAGDKYALTPLIGAAVNGDISLISTLLDAGAYVNHQDVINQASALHWAIFYSNDEAAIFLMDYGASFDLMCLDNEYNAYTLAIAYQNNAIKRHIEEIRARNNPLLGSWNMKEIQFIYADTTYKVHPPQGNLIVSKGRYSIMYVPDSKPRSTFDSLSNPTKEEILSAFRSIVFNSGYYELKNNIFSAIPDIAKVPGFEGGEQRYAYSLDGETLTFKLFDETYPDGEKPEWYQKLEVLFILEKE